jgi:CheY-like chemotaxis protein
MATSEEAGVGPHGGVLVVDDDVDLRETMRDVLEAEGYRVVVASNGKDALEQVRQVPAPGLILLDLAMPVMNGVEFCEALASDPSLPRIPTIVFTAAGRTASRNLAPNIDACLQKPVRLDDLLETVARFTHAAG